MSYMLSVRVGECVFSSGVYVGWNGWKFIVDSKVHLEKATSFQTVHYYSSTPCFYRRGPQNLKKILWD